jgi:adenylate kinase family enzyme
VDGRPRRVSVVGTSGAGKTTLAREVATRLEVPHVELDAVFHQPGWEQLPRDEFRDRVAGVVAGNGWVVDGNYSAVRDLVWDRAEMVVVLDLDRSVVMRQVIARTLRRVATRQQLWNGNREPWSNLMRWRPEHNIMRWAWTTHAKNRARYRAALSDPDFAHVDFVHLTDRVAVRRFVARL